jgi:hypothetical protein
MAPPVNRGEYNYALLVLTGLFGFLFNIAVSIPPLIFLFNVTSWQPRTLFIIWTMVQGAVWLAYVVIFGLTARRIAADPVKQSRDALSPQELERQRIDRLRSMLGPSATLGTFKRFQAALLVRTLVTLSMLIMWWLWFAHTSTASGVNYLSGKPTPYCPGKMDPGFFAFNKLCVVLIFLSAMHMVYELVLMRDLLQSQRTLQELAPPGTPGTVVPAPNAYPANVLSAEVMLRQVPTTVVRAASLWGYIVSAGIFYILAFVLALIFAAQSFDKATSMNLWTVVGFLIAMTVLYFAMLACFYWLQGRTISDALYDPEVPDGSNLAYEFLRGHLTFAFVLVVNWIFLFFYWAQLGVDAVDFSTYPHFNPNPPQPGPHYSQKNAWYVWMDQTDIGFASVVLVVSHALSVFFLSPAVYRRARVPTPQDFNAVAVEALPQWGVYLLHTLYWLAALVVFSFTASAVAGSAWLLTIFLKFTYSFTAIATVFVILAMLFTGLRANAAAARIVAESKSAQAKAAQEAENSQNLMWSLLMWRIMAVLGTYLALSLTNIWLTYVQYETQLKQNNVATFINQPTTLPLDSLTYYWWDFACKQMLLTTAALIQLLVDANSTMSSRVLVGRDPVAGSRSRASSRSSKASDTE